MSHEQAGEPRDPLIDALKEFSAGLRHTYTAILASGAFII